MGIFQKAKAWFFEVKPDESNAATRYEQLEKQPEKPRESYKNAQVQYKGLCFVVSFIHRNGEYEIDEITLEDSMTDIFDLLVSSKYMQNDKYISDELEDMARKELGI